MRSWQLDEQKPVEQGPLSRVDKPTPKPGEHEVLIKVAVCGICHTDLHTVEGDIPLHKAHVTPGHQIVGVIERVGSGVTMFKQGDRVGVPWLNWTDNTCEFCRMDRENLCERGKFTGYDVDGGYADYQVTDERYVVAIPEGFDSVQAAPLLCAGVVGYRALRLGDAKDAKRVGLYGFGASAHIAQQILKYWGADVFVFTRGEEHRKLARQLGAKWVGGSEDDPGELMDVSIIFAPAGQIVPQALQKLRPAGTLVFAGIYMSPIPQLDYSLVWGERVMRSVANATRRDAAELMELAAKIPIHTEVETFPMDQAPAALLKLKQSKIDGAAALVN